MLELIERQAALYALCEDCKSKYDGLCPHEASKCIEYRAINRLPAIEAEPVRHGRWITKDSSTAKCSCCGWWQRTTMYYLPDDIPAFSKCYRFCTSCGARMDADHIADDSKKVGGADDGS